MAGSSVGLSCSPKTTLASMSAAVSRIGRSGPTLTAEHRSLSIVRMDPPFLARRRVLEMLHHGVGPWVQDRLMAAIGPAHDVGRAAVGPAHLEHLTIAVRIIAVATPDSDAITHSC